MFVNFICSFDHCSRKFEEMDAGGCPALLGSLESQIRFRFFFCWVSAQFLQESLLNRALVSEPGVLGFSDFQFFYVREYYFLRNPVGTSGGGISRGNIKGVLDWLL